MVNTNKNNSKTLDVINSPNNVLLSKCHLSDVGSLKMALNPLKRIHLQDLCVYSRFKGFTGLVVELQETQLRCRAPGESVRVRSMLLKASEVQSCNHAVRTEG